MRDLTVATFNVHHCEGRDGILDPSRTSEAISATGADIVALQELDRRMPRSGRVDQPLLISELTGMSVSFFPTLDRGREYGLALASFHPLEPDYVPLPRLDKEEPRAALVLKAFDLWIVATHLATQRKARALQNVALASLVSRLEGAVVVLGDFNEARRDLGPFRDIGVTPAGPHLVTHRGRVVSRQIDHILVGPGVRVGNVRTIESNASDHLPLVADLSY